MNQGPGDPPITSADARRDRIDRAHDAHDRLLQQPARSRRWAEGNLAHWNGYFTLRGRGEVAFDGETVQTRPGELLLLAPGHPRRYRIPEPRMGWEFYWLHFRATPRLTGHLPWFDPRTALAAARGGRRVLRVTLATQLEAAHQFNLTEPDLPGREPIVEALLEAFCCA